ncbi:hypothetical protein [Mucilaginibacter sp. FT3.2]|uniref:hypothetical protein n=1 Tax=Mucilaginibacter sp. FT3.2 TaxID=2723090 RepID=UPI00160DE492|nr:hypothetical protein [Mucilaginibacter sp. FT3.2]MBB6235213.1 hypothetical protein [Mucilaginibacter sp. FT3.2]
MKYILSPIFFCLLNYCSFAQEKLPAAANLPEQVGDIIFNPQTDQYNFKLCDKDNIYQYYGLNTSYKGDIKALKKELFAKIKYQPQFTTVNGSITIRFIVNCKGESGWFRVYQLDGSYQKIRFAPAFVKELSDAVKSLKGWIPGKLPDGTVADTYFYLYFKIVKGHLKDITI